MLVAISRQILVEALLKSARTEKKVQDSARLKAGDLRIESDAVHGGGLDGEQ